MSADLEAAELVEAVRLQAELQVRMEQLSARAFASRDAGEFARLQREREQAWPLANARQDRLRELAKRRTPLPEADLAGLIDALATFSSWSFTSLEWVPLESLARLVRRSINGAGPSAALAGLAERRSAERGPAEARRSAAILTELVGGNAPLIDEDDDWGRAAAPTAGAHPAWRPLLEHAATATASKPSRRWLATAETLVGDLGPEEFAELMTELLGALDAPPSGEMRRGAGIGALVGLDHVPRAVPTERNATTLRGLVWACSIAGGQQIARLVAAAAHACGRKIPDVGARSPRVVNACLWSLAAMQDEAGAEHLVALQQRTRKPAARARVSAALDLAAASAGVSREVLEDRAVPTHGLDAGPLVVRAGKATGEVTVEPPGRLNQRWTGASGRVLTRPPKSVPRDVRDLRSTLAVQRARLERLLAEGTSWPWSRFRDGVLAHPVTGAIAGSLIVAVDDGRSFLPSDRVPDLPADSTVRLWHPAGRPRGDVIGWRERLAELRIVQPFKQAHREVYLLTPAERAAGDHSPRFAGFVLRQHALAAICAARGWAARLQGPFDPGGDPCPTLAQADGLTVTLETEPIEDEALWSGSGIYLYVRTGRVRFRRAGLPVALDDVPPLVFSEALRDIDLSVSIAGIAADPTWPQAAPAAWAERWHQQAFAALSPMGERRREVLERVLPGLPIAERAHLDGRYLVVRGTKGSYRIHLGSAGVLMEPGSRAICIVPAGGGALPGEPGHVWLPFEGDATLALVLSKALMLAADDRIDDPLVRLQLDGGS
jgi:hypothetical protein